MPRTTTSRRKAKQGPTHDEKLKLLAFQRQYERLSNSSIARQGKLRTSKTTRRDLKTGALEVTVSGYEREAFQSQLPILRQFMLKKEPVNFNGICDIISRRSQRPELVAWVQVVQLRWATALAEVPKQVDQQLHQATRSLNDALTRLFYGYGGLFHVNIRTPQEQTSVAAIEELLIHTAFPKLLVCLRDIERVIYWWFDAPNETVPSPKSP